jgi:uncharacterized protein DUF3857
LEISGVHRFTDYRNSSCNRANKNLPARIHLETVRIEVQPDGSATNDVHVELQVLTATAVTVAGQIPIPYWGSMQEVTVLDAYTQKPDGRKFPVDQRAILTRQVPDASLVPLFSDAMEKVIVFPNVEPGDTLVYTDRYRDKATLFPGHFTTVAAFAPGAAIDAADVTISAPKSLGVLVEAHDVEVHKYDAVANDLYTLHYSNLTPAIEDNSAISALNRIPRYFALLVGA